MRSPGRRGLSRGRVALLSVLVLLIVLGSVGLLTSPALHGIVAPPLPTATDHHAVPIPTVNVSVNSNGAMFGFDVQHTHFNPSEHILNPANVSHLMPYWSYSTGSYITYSSPAVANGIVYVGSDDQKLYALDAKTGTVLWTDTNWIASSPTVANGLVYVGSTDYKLYAFHLPAGTT